jgi:hypothetical protein
MVDPVLTIAPADAPLAGLDCQLPADASAPGYYLGPSGEDCWSWAADDADVTADHLFSCDSLTGGDVVVAYTTAPGQQSLRIDALLSSPQAFGYVDVELTEAPCQGGASVACQVGEPDPSYGDVVAVTPETSYLLWVADGFGGNARPDVTLCLSSP